MGDSPGWSYVEGTIRIAAEVGVGRLLPHRGVGNGVQGDG